MNYSLDKVLLKICLIFLCLITISCTNCEKYNSIDFENNLEIFEVIRKEVIKQEWLNHNQNIDLLFLKENIDSISFGVLKKMSFTNIQVFQEVMVFKFSYNSNDTYLDKKIDDKLKANTTNKSCNHFLFYSKNDFVKNQIMNYPRYAECRYENRKINSNWSYSSQIWYCAD